MEYLRQLDIQRCVVLGAEVGLAVCIDVVGGRRESGMAPRMRRYSRDGLPRRRSAVGRLLWPWDILRVPIRRASRRLAWEGDGGKGKDTGQWAYYVEQKFCM